MTSDAGQNLPAVPQIHSLELPVAEFEGEMVRLMLGKIPSITLEMDYGYPRGTHLKLELEVRVRSVNVDEVSSGPHKGDLKREHTFAIEEAKIIGAYTADQLDPGVGGGLAQSGSDVEPEDEPDDETSETDTRPEGAEDGEHAGPDAGANSGSGEGDHGAAAAEYDPGF